MPYPEFFIRIKEKDRKKADIDNIIKSYSKFIFLALILNILLFVLFKFSFWEGIIGDWIIPYSYENFKSMFSKEEYTKIFSEIHEYYMIYIYACIFLSGYVSIFIDRYIKFELHNRNTNKYKKWLSNFLYSIFVYFFVTICGNIFSFIFKYITLNGFLKVLATALTSSTILIILMIVFFVFVHILLYYLLVDITEFMICMVISSILYSFVINKYTGVINTLLYFILYLITWLILRVIRITPIIGGLCAIIAKYCYTLKFVFFTSLKLTFCFISLGFGAKFVDILDIWQNFKFDFKNEIKIKKYKYY